MIAIPGFLVRPCRRWSAFFFTPSDPATLCIIRILLGLCLVWHYGGCVIEVQHFLGPSGWINETTVTQLDELESQTLRSSWGPSIWKILDSEEARIATYYAFLAAIGCFTVGFASRLMCALVLAGHVSFLHRAFVTAYGVDAVISALLLYLLVGPIGARFSVDRQISKLLHPRTRTGPIPVARYWNATLAIRLIQLQMCVIYFCSGISKLQGSTWWNGSAAWYAMTDPDHWLIDFSWIGRLDNLTIQLISLAGTAATLFFEIGFSFLVWKPATRPYMLALAVVLHIGIAITMSLVTFSLVMLTGCLSFIDFSAMRPLNHRSSATTITQTTPRHPSRDLADLPG